jgi:hypothetical protein
MSHLSKKRQIMAKKPTVMIESGKKASAITGYSKKELPGIAKKVVKRHLSKRK